MQTYILFQTNFDNREYKNLSVYFSQYKSWKWLAIKYPNKFLIEIDIDNIYF